MREALKRLNWRFLPWLLAALLATTPLWGNTESRVAQKVQGGVDDQATPYGFPVQIAGVDTNSKVRIPHLDANGNLFVNTSAGTGTGAGQVQGTAADGAAAVGNPVQTGGVDGSGNAQSFLTDTSGREVVVGSAATGAAVSGSPVYIGGQNAAGNAAPIAVSASGTSTNSMNALYVGFQDSGNLVSIPMTRSVGADGATGSSITALAAFGYGFRFNGTNWDRERGNTQETALASAARTSQTDSGDLVNYNGRGILIMVDVTTGSATPGVTPTLQMKDSISGNYKTIWTAAAAITSTAAADYVYALYPGATATAGFTEAQSVVIPRTYRLRFTVADADSLTYSASVATIQ